MYEYQKVYVATTGRYLPGQAVDNEKMDAFIQPINQQSSRIKRRILAENGIQTRHYAIDENGRTVISNAKMAVNALTEALRKVDLPLNRLDFIATGTTGPDQVAPGFANQVQGELKAQPLTTISVQGICASSVGALKAAANSVELGESRFAGVVGSDFPSRLFKKTRFQNLSDNVDFDSHFLRWMLSDGAGAVVLTSEPRPLPGPNSHLSLRLKWIRLKSFSGDLPYCMRIGSPNDDPEKTYLDYDSLSEVDAAGAYLLRQDIRLLPNLFDVGMSEMADLARKGYVNPSQIDHFLCHYSSEKFKGVIAELLDKAKLNIGPEKWYSNLTTRGNTGAASLFIMLDEFLQTHTLEAGQKILCFVPESGRFTVSFSLFEVVDAESPEVETFTPSEETLPELAKTLRGLNGIWHEYRSRVFRSPLAQKVFIGKFTVNDYLRWMENWIPQVREGSVWMRTAIKNLPEHLSELGKIIETHAGEEQFDFNILYKDYRRLGGQKTLEELQRNPGGDALNAFMLATAKGPASFSLLGGTFIIEGTGQRIIPTLLPKIKAAIGAGAAAFKFLEYHGENDIRHMQRWLQCMELVHLADPAASARILTAAKNVADLYALQWELIEV